MEVTESDTGLHFNTRPSTVSRPQAFDLKNLIRLLPAVARSGGLASLIACSCLLALFFAEARVVFAACCAVRSCVFLCVPVCSCVFLCVPVCSCVFLSVGPTNEASRAAPRMTSQAGERPDRPSAMARMEVDAPTTANP